MGERLNNDAIVKHLQGVIDERNALAAAVKRVWALHSPDPRRPDLCAAGCRIESIGGRYLSDCPTRAALNEGGPPPDKYDPALDQDSWDRRLGMSRVADLTAERDALAATLQRVEALCEQVEKTGKRNDWSVSTERIRAALASPADTARDGRADA